jgi:hypothetical protein
MSSGYSDYYGGMAMASGSNNPYVSSLAYLYQTAPGYSEYQLYDTGTTTWYTIKDIPQKYSELHKFMSNQSNEQYMNQNGSGRYVNVRYTSATGAIDFKLKEITAAAAPYQPEQLGYAPPVENRPPVDAGDLEARLGPTYRSQQRTPTPPEQEVNPGPSSRPPRRRAAEDAMLRFGKGKGKGRGGGRRNGR